MKRIALIAAVIISIAASAIAAPRLPADLLDLTDAQKTQAQALRETLRNTTEPLMETQRANREQIRAAVEAGDAAKAGALLIANHELATQIEAAHDTFRSAFEALLTREQKTKFAAFTELMELRRHRAPRPARE